MTEKVGSLEASETTAAEAAATEAAAAEATAADEAAAAHAAHHVTHVSPIMLCMLRRVTNTCAVSTGVRISWNLGRNSLSTANNFA